MGALQAKILGIPRVSVIEFGVASGQGLLNLQSLAKRISAFFGDIRIDVHGFDLGSGLPRPMDYRDVPYTFREGDYSMDVESLKSRLDGTKLWLGPVAETLPEFLPEALKSPVAFASFDLDLYSSTAEAFKLFEFPAASRLPRVVCYFDDILAPDEAFYSDVTGELLAISEFNAAHPTMDISQLRALMYSRPRLQQWQAQIYAFHDFTHERYNADLLQDSWRQMGPL